jgi:Ca2+-dependent lipid-binding protein
MLKSKNPEVNVCKVNEAKGRDQRKVKKPKPQKSQAKSQKPNYSKYASRPKNSKHDKSPHDRNRQWNNYDTLISIPLYHPYNHSPWESYRDMSYFYSPWSSGMSSSPVYFY